jgi:hypothetical protein
VLCANFRPVVREIACWGCARPRDVPIRLLTKYVSTKIFFICNMMQIWKKKTREMTSFLFSTSTDLSWSAETGSPLTRISWSWSF